MTLWKGGGIYKCVCMNIRQEDLSTLSPMRRIVKDIND